ncbi:MAG: metallophosphoesterase [Chloroflexi bacterium]|nr:metallophosphoesterase [Chloroflexota bacterium]
MTAFIPLIKSIWHSLFLRALRERVARVLTLLVLLFSVTGSPTTVATAATEITFSGSEHLGNPTGTSITINVVPDADVNIFYEYGTISGIYTGQTPSGLATAGESYEIVIDGLQPNTRYYYRMQYQVPGDTGWVVRDEHTFHTQRARGSSFTFTVAADSHVNIILGNLDEWKQALDRMATDQPDFFIDLGDTFAMDGVSTAAQADANYLFQRSPDLMGRLSHSSPIFLAIGNHENEEGWNFDDTNPQPVFSMNARKRYFPLPTPGTFYSGNTDNSETRIIGQTPDDHLREDYYAWEWGDALFIVFDPFQYTMQNPYGAQAGEGNDDPATGDRWNWTLGLQQYNWLKETLEGSDAKYKFMFAHHMLGGTQNYVRGGAEAAGWFEWGGYNVNASNQNPVWQFDTRRPGWPEPIHQLMVDNQVSAFFHGHDHHFVHEERDGIVYQLVPSPSQGNSFGFNNYTNSPYVMPNGILSNSGYLRVTISPNNALVEYVSTFNGQVRYTYMIEPNGEPTPAPTSIPTASPTVGSSPTLTNTPPATQTPTASSTIQIGETNILGMNYSGMANQLAAQQVTLPQSATIQSLSYYVAAAGGQLRLGIYNNAGAGPGTLLAQTAAFTPIIGWNTQNVTIPTLLPAGTYWLAFLPQNNALTGRLAFSGSLRYYTSAFGTLPATYSNSPQSATAHFSMYATLSTGPLPTNTSTHTPSNTPVATVSPTRTITPSQTQTNTATATNVFTSTPTSTFTPPATWTNTSMPTATQTSATGNIIQIGETNILSLNYSNMGNYLVAQQVTLPQNATIQSLSYYVATAGGQLRLGIYNNAGNAPGSLQAQTAAFTPVAGWNTQNVTSPTMLPAGTYWLAFLPQNNNLTGRMAFTGTGRYYGYTFSALPTTYSNSSTSGTFHFSMYATLLTGTPTSPPPAITP